MKPQTMDKKLIEFKKDKKGWILCLNDTTKCACALTHNEYIALNTHFLWIYERRRSKIYANGYKQGQEMALDLIAHNEGWEETRDKYAKKLLLPIKYPLLVKKKI